MACQDMGAVMAEALKYAAIFMPMFGFLSVAAVSCDHYNTESEKLKHARWVVQQEMCKEKGGLMEQTWGVWTCEFGGE